MAKNLFQKGNKLGGRKAMPEEYKQALSEATPKAIATLVKLMDDKDSSVRLRASIEIINRELGKPKENVEVTGKDGGSIIINYPDAK